MSDLTDFLLARIAEDEEQLATAKRLGVVPIPGGSRMFSGIGNHPTVSETRLAAECDAKRRIVEADRRSYELRADLDVGSPAVTFMDDVVQVDGTWMSPSDYRALYLQPAPPSLTLRLLALPYADHPEYREEWRP